MPPPKTPLEQFLVSLTELAKATTELVQFALDEMKDEKAEAEERPGNVPIAGEERRGRQRRR